MSTDLERLYQDAKTALAGKDYYRASELLRQVLKLNVDYKDAAQLLARVIKLSRRRWYNNPSLWLPLGVLSLIVLGIYLFPKLQGFHSQPAPAPVVVPADTLVPTSTPSATATTTETATLLPTPIPIPLMWKRISTGHEFVRDMVTAFATDKNDPDVIYAAMKNAGVYKTIDGGLSWQPAHHGLSNTQVESLLIDSRNPRILYAGTIGGVFKTEDGGENWFRIGDGTYLLMDYQDSSHLYAREENGIYETTDQGNNWATTYTLNKSCPDDVHSWAVHPKESNVLFIGGGETCPGVFQSNDNGGTWALIGMGDKPDLDALVIGLNEEENASIFARFPGAPGFMWELFGWYASHDGGVSWSIENGPTCDGILVSDPEKLAILYCGDSSSLYVTRGKGDPWKPIPDTQSRIYTAIQIDHPNGTERILTGATDVSKTSNPNVGIFISTDSGASWVERIGGIGSAWAEYKIDPMDKSRMYLATYYTGYVTTTGCKLYRSLDSGKSWSALKSNAAWCGPAFDSVNGFYLIELGALQKSWNDGKVWLWERDDVSNLAHNLPEWFSWDSTVKSISASPYIDGLIYAAGNNIYYSTNEGGDWQLSTGSEGLWDARLYYTDQSKLIYAIGRYHQAFSTDNGVTWQNCGEDVNTSRSDTRLALDLLGSHLYLATPGQGVLVSTDECQSWHSSNIGLNNLFVNTLAIDPNNPEIVYAGTDGGAFISFDSGQTWGEVSNGLLGATVVYSVAVDSESNVYAATPYGIFKLEGK